MPEETAKALAEITASGRRASLRLAQFFAETPRHDLLDYWLEMAPEPSVESEWHDSALGASVNAARTRVTWSATNRLYVILPAFLAFLDAGDMPADAIAGIRRDQDQLDPSSFGAWVEVTAETVNLGWCFTGQYWLADAAPLIQSSNMQGALLDWANRHDVDRIDRFGRSLNLDEPYTDLWFPLLGDTAMEQLAVGLDAFDALGVPSLPPDVDAILQTMDPPPFTPLTLSVWLLDDGVAKVGVRIPTPDTTTMLLLSELAGTADHADLAEFEGALGIEERDAVECQQLASGFDVEMHYTLP